MVSIPDILTGDTLRAVHLYLEFSFLPASAPLAPSLGSCRTRPGLQYHHS